MKTKFYLPLIAAFAVTSFASCNKEKPGRSNGNNAVVSSSALNVSVQAGDAYKLNLSSYGNGSARIIQQAASYSISEVAYSSTSRSYVYTYTSNANPKAGESITDKVILKITNAEDQGITAGGCYGDHDKEEKNVTINFTVN